MKSDAFARSVVVEKISELLDREIEFLTVVRNDPEIPHIWSLIRRWGYIFICAMAVISAAYRFFRWHEAVLD